MRFSTVLRKALLIFALAGIATFATGCPHGRHFHHH